MQGNCGEWMDCWGEWLDKRYKYRLAMSYTQP